MTSRLHPGISDIRQFPSRQLKMQPENENLLVDNRYLALNYTAVSVNPSCVSSMDSIAISFPVAFSPGPSHFIGHACSTDHTITGLPSSLSNVIVTSRRSTLGEPLLLNQRKSSLLLCVIPLFRLMLFTFLSPGLFRGAVLPAIKPSLYSIGCNSCVRPETSEKPMS